MSRLLELPLEIRSVILTQVLAHTHPAPTDCTLGSDRAGLDTWTGVEEDFFQTNMHVRFLTSPTPYIPNSHGILYTCRQLRAETQSLLAKLKVIYKLDLQIVNGRELWPTWLSIPTRAKHIDEIHVNVRVTGSGRPCLRYWRSGRGEPTTIVVRWFFRLFEHVLKYGATAAPVTKSPIRDLIIKRLVLHVRGYDQKTPYGYTPQHYMCPYCSRRCADDGRSMPDFSTESLNEFLHDQLYGLCRTERAMVPYSSKIFRGVGSIELLSEGVLPAKFELGRLLMRDPIVPWIACRAWRFDILMARRAVGLCDAEQEGGRQGEGLAETMSKTEIA